MRKARSCSNQDDRGCWRGISLQQELLQARLPLPHFFWVSQSSQSIHKNVISIIGSDWKSLLSLIRVMRRVHTISHERCSSFFGVGGSLFSFSLFSCSSLSSMSANPIGRVSDWDRRELSGPDPCCLCPGLLVALLV